MVCSGGQSVGVSDGVDLRGGCEGEGFWREVPQFDDGGWGEGGECGGGEGGVGGGDKDDGRRGCEERGWAWGWVVVWLGAEGLVVDGRFPGLFELELRCHVGRLLLVGSVLWTVCGGDLFW